MKTGNWYWMLRSGQVYEQVKERGSFTGQSVCQDLYLVEAKWQNEKIGEKDDIL